jgi:serine/threonine protein kinase
MADLHDFSAEFKARKVSKIPDLLARNLVSQMLSKEPSRRPRASQILAHPFLSGKQAPRMVGQKPEYDVFLSYRVATEAKFTGMIYNALTEAGLKVWWDQVSCQWTSLYHGFLPVYANTCIFLRILYVFDRVCLIPSSDTVHESA